MKTQKYEKNLDYWRNLIIHARHTKKGGAFFKLHLNICTPCNIFILAH